LQNPSTDSIRICPNCGYKVQNALLRICPECKAPLGTESSTLTPEEEKRVIQKISRRFFRHMIFWGSAMVVVVALSLCGLRKGLEVSLKRSIEAQLEKPRIQALINEAASRKAENMIREQISPTVKRLRERISSKVIEFEEFQSAMKREVEQEHQAVLDEVVKVQSRSMLLELGDKAIWDLSRPAYEQLLGIANEAGDEVLRLAAKSEIIRVKNAFTGSARTRGVFLSRVEEEGKETLESDFDTTELIDLLLNHPNWKFRARSAQMLAERKEPDVPQALLESMREDQNLEVFKEALKSFEAITGYQAPDVFGYTSCNDWWKENSETFIESLEKAE